LALPKAGTVNASHCLPNPLALPKAFGTVVFRLAQNDFLGCGFTQSLSNKREAFVWLF
jgi:hypothetical protein